jgi:hypothetical protein
VTFNWEVGNLTMQESRSFEKKLLGPCKITFLSAQFEIARQSKFDYAGVQLLETNFESLPSNF